MHCSEDWISQIGRTEFEYLHIQFGKKPTKDSNDAWDKRGIELRNLYIFGLVKSQRLPFKMIEVIETISAGLGTYRAVEILDLYLADMRDFWPTNQADVWKYCYRFASLINALITLYRVHFS